MINDNLKQENWIIFLCFWLSRNWWLAYSGFTAIRCDLRLRFLMTEMSVPLVSLIKSTERNFTHQMTGIRWPTHTSPLIPGCACKISYRRLYTRHKFHHYQIQSLAFQASQIFQIIWFNWRIVEKNGRNNCVLSENKTRIIVENFTATLPDI